MTRLSFIVLLLIATGAGCQSSKVRVAINPAQARQADLRPTGGIAADEDGLVYLTTASNLVRYNPRSHELTDLLTESRQDIRDVAFTGDGVALVLRSSELSAYVSGYLVKVVDLPAQAQALSCDHGYAYIQARDASGSTRLLRYGLAARTLETMAILDDPLQAICALRGGCLIACGGKVFKLTDPTPANPGSDGRQAAVVLLFAIDSPIISLAADPDRKIVYVADKDMTYAWAKGKIVPIFPSGGRLAWREDTLTVCHPKTGQVVQLGAAASQVDRVLEQLAKPPRPAPTHN